ncbi:hypothetical protein JOE11_004696 [Robbsia andropogonis]|uniref:DUF637 domain-containing protein n=1 Tax=Robbsia andropogonis TaxID=28092 RepID=UPI003D1E66EF
MAIAAAIAVSVVTYGAASGAVGAAAGATAGSTFAAVTASSAAVSAGLGNVVVSAALAGMASSATSQLINTGSLDLNQIGEAGLVSGITAGLLNGITYSAEGGLGFSTGTNVLGSGSQSLAQLAGLQNLSSLMSPSATGTGAALSTQLAAAVGSAAISAGVQTAVEGGSYLRALKGSLVSNAAAIGAYEIGQLSQPGSLLEQGSAAYVLAHAALGCAAGAASSTGCEGGAIGGATSAIVAPLLVNAAGGSANLTNTQRAEIVGLATLLGGTNALLGNVNGVGGATSAENEALNNSTLDHESEFEKERQELKKQLDSEKAALGEAAFVQKDGVTVAADTPLVAGLAGAKVGGTASGGSVATNTGNALLLSSPTNSEPWMGGTALNSYPSPSGGMYIQMAMAPGQTNPGGWGTLDSISSVDYVRNSLAVTPAFKTQIASVQAFKSSTFPKGCKCKSVQWDPRRTMASYILAVEIRCKF